MRERERAVVRAALWLGAIGWLAWAVARPPAPPLEACPAPCSGAAALLFGVPLDLNRASAADLDVLPGIGPARARAIVDARERRPFRRVTDLRAVHGIGPRTVAGLAGWVTVAPLPPDR